MTRTEMLQQLAAMKAELAVTTAAIAELEAAQVSQAQPAEPTVSALDIGISTFHKVRADGTSPVVANVPLRRPAAARVRDDDRRFVATAADFPTVPNAAQVPELPVDNQLIAQNTSMDAIRSGEYGKHRDYLLALVRNRMQPTGHAYTGSHLLALGDQSASPSARHPLAAGAARRLPQSPTAVQHPQGLKTDRAMSMVLAAAAKERARARKLGR